MIIWSSIREQVMLVLFLARGASSLQESSWDNGTTSRDTLHRLLLPDLTDTSMETGPRSSLLQNIPIIELPLENVESKIEKLRHNVYILVLHVACKSDGSIPVHSTSASITLTMTYILTAYNTKLKLRVVYIVQFSMFSCSCPSIVVLYTLTSYSYLRADF